MPYTIEQIEDEIIDQLQGLKTSLDVRAIDTYCGQLETDNLNQLAAQRPAIYVCYGGSKYIDHEARQIEQMSFYIFVIDKSLRHEAESRRGGTNNPGTYSMLHAIRTLLLNKQLGMEIYPFTLQSEEFVGFIKGISIYVAQYTTAQFLLAPMS